jgi:hypothetical protein
MADSESLDDPSTDARVAESKLRLAWLTFFIKYSIVAIAALWALVSGNSYAGVLKAKADAEKAQADAETARARIELARAQAEKEVADAQLAELQLWPQGVAEIAISPQGSWKIDQSVCSVTGVVKITNKGTIPMTISDITFSVYSLPPLRLPDGDAVESFSVNAALAQSHPLFTEKLADSYAVLAHDESLTRTFGYAFRPDKILNYVVVAQPSGTFMRGGKAEALPGVQFRGSSQPFAPCMASPIKK